MARHAARPARAMQVSWRTRLAAVFTATIIAVVGLVAVPTAAFATHPSLSGVGPDCVSEATPGVITWTLGGDTSYPKETATVVWQSAPTTPTLVGQSVKNTQTISATQAITSAGKYDFEVKVQWTNHKKDNLVSQKASVKVKECETPKDATASVTVTPATCDAPATLVYGDIVNATFSGTPNGTAGPGNYDVTATANSGHKMTDGTPSWNFTGALSDKLPKQSTDPSKPCYDKPFDWNWQYTVDCSGITIPFPSNLPSSQFGVIEVNFRFMADGKETTINYKLEGDAYWAKYPNGHAGVTLVIPWNDPLWRNGSIPTSGVWTGLWAQVHGTDYHWEGSFQCGSSPEPEIVTGTATFTQLSCTEGSANSAKADAVPGGVWTISADGVDSISLPIGEGYDGGVPDGFPFDDITFTLSDVDAKDPFTATPWTGTWAPVDPTSLDCRVANAKAWVEVVEGPTCDTDAKPQFWTENATWNDDIVPGSEPNTWVRTATAIDGSKFENGESTIAVTYTLAPATGDCVVNNAKAWVEIVAGPTCDAPAKPQFSLENATWAGEPVAGTELNTWKREATAVKGSVFENGEASIWVTYKVDPATGKFQSTDPKAPCYKAPALAVTGVDGPVLIGGSLLAVAALVTLGVMLMRAGRRRDSLA